MPKTLSLITAEENLMGRRVLLSATAALAVVLPVPPRLFAPRLADSPAMVLRAEPVIFSHHEYGPIALCRPEVLATP